MGLLERLGLHRPLLRAWAMYDWGNSAFFTVVVTAVFPIYFQRVAAQGLEPATATARFSYTTSAALVVVALLAPILGALADFRALRKRLLLIFVLLGVTATSALWFVGEGNWALGALLFALGNICVLLSIVFNDSLLPHIASSREVDRVSTAAYALGYLGGGLLLALVLYLVTQPAVFGLERGAATRLGFVLTALWWLLFSLPVLRRVPEPARVLESDERVGQSALRVTFARLGETMRELSRYRQAVLLLFAVLLYNDGVSTIYRLATTFGNEIGLPENDLITAILLVQFVGVPFAFLFGLLATRIGAKRSILIALAVYVAISGAAYFVRTSAHFFALAIAVASVQGGVQALSRSLFASMVPQHKSSEFFGCFGVAERFAAVFGPLLFGLVTQATGSSRNAIVSIVVLFIAGGWLLTRVDVPAGQRVAQEAEQNVRNVHPAAPLPAGG